MLLSLAGGALGLLLAAGINKLVGGIKLPMDIALVFDLRLDWRVMLFALGLSILTGVVFSLLPALQSSKPALVPSLKDDAKLGGFRRSRLRNSLVVAQVSLSLVLLVCAGLIVRSLQAAQKMRPGFDTQNAVAISFDVGLQGYDETKGRAFQHQILERARAMPGVRSAALTSSLPLALNYNSSGVYLEGQPADRLPAICLCAFRRRSARVFSIPWESRFVAAILPRTKIKRNHVSRSWMRSSRRNFSRAGSDRQTIQFQRTERSALGNHWRRGQRQA